MTSLVKIACTSRLLWKWTSFLVGSFLTLRGRQYSYYPTRSLHTQWCNTALLMMAIESTTATISASAIRSRYRIVERSERRQQQQLQQHPVQPTWTQIEDMRQLQDSDTSEQGFISFDGDIDQIIALALAKARLAPTQSPSPTVAPTPTQTTANMPVMKQNFCSGADLNQLEIVTWKYTIETAPNADIVTVIGEVEEILQETLVPILLECKNQTVADANIVALEATIPRDTISTDTVCVPEIDASNICTAVDGKLRLFLGNQDSASLAITLTIDTIERVIQNPEFPFRVETGLVKITYLEETGSSESPSGNDESDNETIGQQTGMGLTSYVLVAAAGATLVCFVGTLYYLRRGTMPDSAATQMAGSSVDDSRMLEQARSSSPFSEMLPLAYQFNENMSILSGNGPMSTVPEDESSRSSANDSIMMSENGYTTEGNDDATNITFDLPRSLSSSSLSPLLLGARKRSGAEVMSEMSSNNFSDSETDTDGTHNASILLASDPHEESTLADEHLLYAASTDYSPTDYV